MDCWYNNRNKSCDESDGDGYDDDGDHDDDDDDDDLQQPVELCDQWVATLRLDTHKIPRH